MNFSARDPEDFPLRPCGLVRSEVLGELLARGDVELSEGVAKVRLHGRQANDERLGNLPVGQSLGSEVSNAPLGPRERVNPTER